MLILSHLSVRFLPLALLNGLEHILFSQIILIGFLLQVGACHFIFQKFLLDFLEMGSLDGWTGHTILFVNLRQCLLQILDLLDSGVNHCLLQISNALVRFWKMFVKLKLELEKKSQGRSSLFAHDLMNQFRIKRNFEVPKGIFDLIEVVDLRVLVWSI